MHPERGDAARDGIMHGGRLNKDDKYAVVRDVLLARLLSCVHLLCATYTALIALCLILLVLYNFLLITEGQEYINAPECLLQHYLGYITLLPSTANLSTTKASVHHQSILYSLQSG